MIQPKFQMKQGQMKSRMHRGMTNWRKHMLYGGAAALGVGSAMLMHHSAPRDLPGPRSPAFYGHRYSHMLPRGAHQAAMRHGTAAQRQIPAPPPGQWN